MKLSHLAFALAAIGIAAAIIVPAVMPASPQHPIVAGIVSARTPTSHDNQIFPVMLEDGTRCVVAVGAQRSGVSITCDWTPRSKP